MKTVVFTLAFAALTWASPQPVSHKIKRHNIHVEPIGPAPKSIGSRIIGGFEVEPNSVPYQVGVFANGGVICGGSLLSDQWILTAAHCVEDAFEVEVILGAHNILEEEPTQQTYTASRWITHPSWDGTTLMNDVALIQLPISITLTAEIQPVALAPSLAGTYEGRQANLTGWGSLDDSDYITEMLNQVTLQVIGNSECSLSFGSIIDDSHLCTSGAGGAGPCAGDSGSPLVFNGFQIGLVSFGAQSCSQGHPTVYARISSYVDWIVKTANLEH